MTNESHETLHIRVTFLYPKTDESTFDMDYYTSTHMPMLAAADYRSIGLTARAGQTAVTNAAALEGSGAFPFQEAPQPEPEADCVESAFAGDAPWMLAGLEKAAPAVTDAMRFRRMRMADYFLEQPAFESFDGLGCVAESSGTSFTRASTWVMRYALTAGFGESLERMPPQDGDSAHDGRPSEEEIALPRVSIT